MKSAPHDGASGVGGVTAQGTARGGWDGGGWGQRQRTPAPSRLRSIADHSRVDELVLIDSLVMATFSDQKKKEEQ